MIKIALWKLCCEMIQLSQSNREICKLWWQQVILGININNKLTFDTYKKKMQGNSGQKFNTLSGTSTSTFLNIEKNDL